MSGRCCLTRAPEHEEAEEQSCDSACERCNDPEQNRVVVVFMSDIDCDGYQQSGIYNAHDIRQIESELTTRIERRRANPPPQ